MSGHIYILTDGINTKIGITISLDKRLSAYNTHNPNFYQYKVYDCEIDIAKKIEAVIKIYFKEQITGSGKEWFAVPPEQIDRIVAVFLEKPVEEILTPAMHGVRLSKQGAEQLQAIETTLGKSEGRNNKNSHEQKDKMAEIFASTFKLGIPENRLPEDIVHKDNLCVDIYQCAKNLHEVEKALNQNYVRLPYEDHTIRFYHLVKLVTGSYIALCSSIVFMPYLKAVEDKFSEIVEVANRYGLYAFQDHEWSCHAPGNSGLILCMQKTPIQKRLGMWENSFRKWVIERSKLLEQERIGNQEAHEIMTKTIFDICHDSTFPLHVQSVEGLYNDYLKPFFRIEFDGEHFMQETYDFLFDKWKTRDFIV
jgi:hypothetical protein